MTEQSPRNDLEKSEGGRQELTVAAEPCALPFVIKVIFLLLRAGEGLCKCRRSDRQQDENINLLKF